MAVKAANNIASLDSLVPTLLIFSAYPYISKLDLLAPSIIQQAAAIKKVIEEIARIRVKK